MVDDFSESTLTTPFQRKLDAWRGIGVWVEAFGAAPHAIRSDNGREFGLRFKSRAAASKVGAMKMMRNKHLTRLPKMEKSKGLIER